MKKVVLFMLLGGMVFAKPADWKEPTDIKKIITKYERLYNLPVGLAHCVAYTESRFNPTARSRVVGGYRSDGLFQIYRKYMYGDGGFIDMFSSQRQGEFQWYNPEHSAEIGCAYLAWLINYYQGHLYLAVLAYNYGTGNLRKIKRISDVPKSCTNYADSIIKLLDSYEETW